MIAVWTKVLGRMNFESELAGCEKTAHWRRCPAVCGRVGPGARIRSDMLADNLSHKGRRKALPEGFPAGCRNLAFDKVNLDRLGDDVAALSGLAINVAAGLENNLFNGLVVNQFSMCCCDTPG